MEPRKLTPFLLAIVFGLLTIVITIGGLNRIRGLNIENMNDTVKMPR